MRDGVEDAEKTVLEQAVDETEHAYFRFHRNRLRFLLDILSKYRPESTLLDVGFGFLHFLIGAKSAGFDDLHGLNQSIGNDVVKRRADKHGIDIRGVDLRNGSLPFDESFFDLVFFSETLEHFDFHPQPVFKELHRVMKPGATLIITTPNLTRLNNRIKLLLGRSVHYDVRADYRHGAHWREYTRSELEFLLESSGFGSRVVSFVDFDYPGQKRSVRALNRLCGSLHAPLRSNLVVIAARQPARGP